jgi:ribosomal 50S subunit-recycling heat shock protein
MRLDKFLKNSRIIKRRTVAKDACEQGRVEVNGRVAKPGLELKTGDEIQVTFGSNVLKVRVLAMPESVRKDDANSMYEVIDQGQTIS